MPTTRRRFLQTTLAGSAGLIGAPSFLPESFLCGQGASPNRRIQIAQIGCGRMGTEDMLGTITHTDLCRIVAVCDLDSTRLAAAKGKAEKFYADKGEAIVEVKAYKDYREVLARTDIDAVIVTPPDHWHAIVAVEAILAGKDLHVQKPLTYDISEAIALRTACARSSASCRRAASSVRRSPGTRSAWRPRRCATAASGRSTR